ncbi:MAG TPA: GNAT family N-acetyltransferase [Chloroflexia bacterium]|jgi:CelD/BcsL family acetyltransferase involved in cellulose biosynthesis
MIDTLTRKPDLSIDVLLFAAPETSSTIAVTEVNDRATFISLEAEWDALVATTNAGPFYRHDFIRIWIDNFAPRTRLRILVGRDEHGTLVAALPLMQERGSLLGMPTRQLTATANFHSPRFDLLALNAGAAGRAFFRHLSTDKSWDVLRIDDVLQGGNAWHLYEAARLAGSPVGTWTSLQSPYIPLPGTYAEFQAQLSSKFRANLRRRRKKLEEMGRVTVECVTGGMELDGKLEEGYALEQSGWKGRGGTAIAQDNATWGFYTELARTASYGDHLALYFLRLDGKPIAFHYGLEYGRRYYLLKPAYDEAYRECSPGQLLMDEVLKDCVARGFEEFDFLGPDMTWKRDWTEHVRPHTWLFIFRDSPYGRLLHKAKFKLSPAAKGLVARWRTR